MFDIYISLSKVAHYLQFSAQIPQLCFLLPVTPDSGSAHRYVTKAFSQSAACTETGKGAEELRRPRQAEKMALGDAWKQISWFYYQYLLVTALYMLEPWERTVFSILLR